MKHLTETDLIRLRGGELSPDERVEADRHLADCQECTRLLADLAAAWATLGEWQVSTEGRDVGPAVFAAVDRERVAPPRRLVIHPWRVGRAAAAILLAVGLGHAAGRFVTAPATSAPSLTSHHVTDETAAELLALHAFELPSATGFSLTLLEPTDEGATEEEPS